MPRLREIPRAEAATSVLTMYDFIFGPDRDPVAEPGSASGTPGDWWTVFANDPAVFDDRQIRALSYITMLYELHATLSRALRTESDDLDEPVQEIGAKVPLMVSQAELDRR